MVVAPLFVFSGGPDGQGKISRSADDYIMKMGSHFLGFDENIMMLMCSDI